MASRWRYTYLGLRRRLLGDRLLLGRRLGLRGGLGGLRRLGRGLGALLGRRLLGRGPARKRVVRRITNRVRTPRAASWGSSWPWRATSWPRASWSRACGRARGETPIRVSRASNSFTVFVRQMRRARAPVGVTERRAAAVVFCQKNAERAARTYDLRPERVLGGTLLFSRGLGLGGLLRRLLGHGLVDPAG
jgi:hypothetical protein